MLLLDVTSQFNLLWLLLWVARSFGEAVGWWLGEVGVVGSGGESRGRQKKEAKKITLMKTFKLL